MYRLVILHRGSAAWASEIEAATRAAMKRIILRDDLLLRLNRVPDAEDHDRAPVVVVFLASREAARQPEIVSSLTSALSQSFPVLPLYRDGDTIEQCVPAEIQRLNALNWDSPQVNAPVYMLRMLGLAESERRLFLSYRRAETSELAYQLRQALSERSFDVFMDRFSVPPGDDFQRRLDIELSDKAFVLLLESQSAIDSPWVRHEVAFALGNQLAIMALTLPGLTPTGLFPAVDPAFRHMLKSTAFVGGSAGRNATLTDRALKRVLDEIEIRYAGQLRRRREQLLGSINDWIQQSGAQPVPVQDWAVLADMKDRTAQLFMITPRPPTPFDLRIAGRLQDRLKRSHGGRLKGVLVHDTASADAERTELVDWICKGRGLRASSVREIPQLLGLA